MSRDPLDDPAWSLERIADALEIVADTLGLILDRLPPKEPDA